MMKFLSCWSIKALGVVHTTVKEVGESTTVLIVTEYWGPAYMGQVDHIIATRSLEAHKPDSPLYQCIVSMMQSMSSSMSSLPISTFFGCSSTKGKLNCLYIVRPKQNVLNHRQMKLVIKACSSSSVVQCCNDYDGIIILILN